MKNTKVINFERGWETTSVNAFRLYDYDGMRACRLYQAANAVNPKEVLKHVKTLFVVPGRLCRIYHQPRTIEGLKKACLAWLDDKGFEIRMKGHE